MSNILRFLVATSMLLIASPILAHVSLEHVLSYIGETTEVWKILSMMVSMLGLVAIISYLSVKTK